jgi:outer membrane protein TolC
VNRARSEVEIRRRERIDIEADLGIVSARLAQLLLLPPTVDLRPAEPTVLPVELVPACAPLDELVAAGLLNRPELAESRALVAAALTRWRQSTVGPLIPRVDFSYTGGMFGGGRNEFMGDFAARGDGTAQLVWVGHNLFAGDVARARVSRTQYNEANLRVVEVQAQVAAEVTAAAKLVRARKRSLDSAREAVTQSLAAWQKLRIAAYGLGDPRSKLLDTLEPLVALQTLAQTRAAYLTEVVEYNKAQFRLYTAMGQPPVEALPTAQAIPLTLPTAPQPSALPSPGQP